jgi:quercetin dioxygenase-like cupin family protein
MADSTTATAARVVSTKDSPPVRGLGGVDNRFLIDGSETGGRFSLVQHLFAPRALAAPMHRHQDEDEYTYVLTGHIGAVLGDEELIGGPGDLIFKPRRQWHTFWNEGDEPAAVLEIISTAGLEQLFRAFATLSELPDPATLTAMAGRYRCELDFDATMPIVQRHGLVF